MVRLKVEPHGNALLVRGGFGGAVLPKAFRKYYAANIVIYETILGRFANWEKWFISPDFGTLLFYVFKLSRFKEKKFEHYTAFIDEKEKVALVLFRSRAMYVHKNELYEMFTEREAEINGVKIVDAVGNYFIGEDGSLFTMDGFKRIYRHKESGIIVDGVDVFDSFCLKVERDPPMYNVGITRYSDDEFLEKYGEVMKDGIPYRKMMLFDEKLRYAGTLFGQHGRFVYDKTKKERVDEVFLKKGRIVLGKVYKNPIYKCGPKILQLEGAYTGARLLEKMDKCKGIVLLNDGEDFDVGVVVR